MHVLDDKQNKQRAGSAHSIHQSSKGPDILTFSLEEKQICLGCPDGFRLQDPADFDDFQQKSKRMKQQTESCSSSTTAAVNSSDCSLPLFYTEEEEEEKLNINI